MKIRSCITALLGASTVAGVTITQDTTTSGAVDFSLGVTVAPGVKYSIWNNAVSAIAGSLNVGSGGGFYISSDNPLLGLSVTLLGVVNTITNNGVVSFNSVVSATAPTYNLVGASFTNNGQVYFSSKGSIFPGVQSITSSTWNNNGLISIYQESRSTGAVVLGPALGDLNNNGNICLYNQIWIQTGNVKGNGCWQILGDSLAQLNLPASPIDTTQVFYMGGPDSELLATLVTASQTYTVAGFGNGNFIGLTGPILSWNYNSGTGVLTLYSGVFNTLPQRFLIGPNYVQSKFSTTSHIFSGVSAPLNNAIVYNAAPPNPKPAKCGVCTSTVAAPKPTSSSSTSTKPTTAPRSARRKSSAHLPRQKDTHSGLAFLPSSPFFNEHRRT